MLPNITAVNDINNSQIEYEPAKKAFKVFILFFLRANTFHLFVTCLKSMKGEKIFKQDKLRLNSLYIKARTILQGNNTW